MHYVTVVPGYVSMSSLTVHFSQKVQQNCVDWLCRNFSPLSDTVNSRSKGELHTFLPVVPSRVCYAAFACRLSNDTSMPPLALQLFTSIQPGPVLPSSRNTPLPTASKLHYLQMVVVAHNLIHESWKTGCVNLFG